MKLESMLYEELNNNPEKYNLGTIRRVSKVVRHVDKKPGFNVPYRYLKELEDLQLYFKLHPEWHEKNVVELQKKHKEGYAFYTFARSWTKNKAGDNESLRNNLMRKILPNIGHPFDAYDTIDEWVNWYDAHPDSTAYTRKAFRESFYGWVNRMSGSNEEYAKTLRNTLFPEDKP